MALEISPAWQKYAETDEAALIAHEAVIETSPNAPEYCSKLRTSATATIRNKAAQAVARNTPYFIEAK